MVHCRFIKPPSENDSLFLENMSKNLSRYIDSYENITLLGDFNMNLEDKNLQHFTASGISFFSRVPTKD